MMIFWIALLRATGTILFLFGVVGGAVRMLAYSGLFRFWDELYLYTVPVLENFALTVVCFGAASALSAQRRMEARIARATAQRRRPAPQPSFVADYVPAESPPRPDVAPVAPDWPELKLGIHPEVNERRLARGRRLGTDDPAGLYSTVVAHGVRIGTPTVKEAPPPVRITPGTENQYRDTPPPEPAPEQFVRRAQMSRRPHQGGVDRELLKQARDTQIRQRQAELMRKRDTGR